MCWTGPVDAAALARSFELGTAVSLSDGPVARGKQGVVWRLETDQGDWAVKVPFGPVAEDEVRLSTQFQESARAAGVPTPAVRRTQQGSVFAAIDGTPVRVYEWVDLSTADLLLDPAVVGSVVATMHRVADPSPEPADPWYQEAIGARQWDELVEQLREAGAPFAARLADLRDELVALESWLEPPSVMLTCHRDLWKDNVLPTPDGGVCVIDWENSGPADPSQELACVVFEFARSDAGRARVLTESYRDAGGPGAVRRRGDFSMLIAQLGHVTETAAADWLTPNPRSPERADAAAWIGEVLDEPHTRELLETLLRQVSAS
jgi:Ser/Thr protein kinase RdoA (MazF antagonist)